MPQHLQPRLLAALLVSAAALAGCGTTVQQATGQPGAPTVDQGLGDGSTPATGITPDGTPVMAPSAGQGNGTQVPVAAVPTFSAPGGGATTAPGQGAPRASVTRPVRVGVAMVDYSALAATFGVAAPQGDPYASWKNLIAYLNKHGGLAGRQLQGDYYSIDGAAADSASAVQGACTHFTQDKRADIVMTAGLNNSQGFSRCLLRSGIPQFDVGQYSEDAGETVGTPNQFTPAALAHDRMATTLMGVSVERGWLTKKDRLGVLTQNCPVDNRVYEKQIVPAMQRAGIPVQRSTTNCIRGNADIGAAATQIQGAVLKFRSDGVTAVTLLGAPEGAGVLLFAQNASQQKWYPRILLTSNSFAYDNSNGVWPTDQLPGMRGIGFSPLLDVGLKAPTTPRQARAQASCKAMDPSRGGANSSSQPTAAVTLFYGVCDGFRLLGAMLTTTGGAIGVSSFVNAYPSAASGLASAKLYDGVFATENGRRDGARSVVPFSYKKDGCRCFSFDGGAVPTR